MRLTDEKGGSIYTTGLGPLQVVATERLFTPPPLDQEVGATFGDEIILLGYNLSPVVNSEAELELIWRALQAPTADYIVFVHLLNPDGTCCTWQQDTMPGSGTYATGRWLPDEVVVDEYKIILPGDLPPGDYPIEIGLYIAETGQRLGVQSAADVTSDALLLQPLTLP
jgi:hypothetical protein